MDDEVIMIDNYILIKDGYLVSKDYDSEKNDILVKGERIVKICPKIEENDDWKVIDAEGRIVSPGFINFHSHCDLYFINKEHLKLYEPLMFQGVTTSLCGNCGFSIFPITKRNLRSFNKYINFLLYKEIDYKWGGFKEYIKYIDNNILFNFASLTGCGTLRVNAAGFKRELDEKELNIMDKLLIETLDNGSFGISSGLMYMPGTFSNTGEIIRLAKIAKKYPNTIYSSHMRGYSDTFIQSVKEVIEIGEKTGIKVNCSHLGPFGIKFGPKIEEVLKLIEDARDRGIDISYDSLSYPGGNTTIMAIFPPWAYEKGTEKFLKDIKNDSFYRKVIDYMETYIPKWPSWECDGWTDNFIRSLGWENIIILGTKNKNIFGKNFIQVAEERNTNLYETLRDVLIEENTNITIYFRGVGGALDYNSEVGMEYFDMMIENKLYLPCVDTVFSKSGISMPFLYGTYPRIINRYVKNKKTLMLKDVIERFTCNVAERIGIKKRGYLRGGYFADIVIFDYDNYKDYPDIFSSKPKYSTGVEYLLINGNFAIKKGRNMKIKAGKVIRNK